MLTADDVLNCVEVKTSLRGGKFTKHTARACDRERERGLNTTVPTLLDKREADFSFPFTLRSASHSVGSRRLGYLLGSLLLEHGPVEDVVVLVIERAE
jgi:hypothetical protein